MAKKPLRVKRLSDTRWSARADSTNSLKNGYKEIAKLLFSMAVDETLSQKTRLEARSLASKLDQWDNALITVMWDSLLQRINMTSKKLQDPAITLNTASALCKSLSKFVESIRNSGVEALEEKAATLTNDRQYSIETRRIRQPKRFFDEMGIEYTTNMSAIQKFRVEVINATCDRIIEEIRKRTNKYLEIDENFNIFLNIMILTGLTRLRKKLKSP